MGTNREQDSSASPPLPIADPAPSFAPADSQFAVVKEDCRCLVSSAESLESNGIVSPAQSDQVSECCCSPRRPSLRLAATASNSIPTPDPIADRKSTRLNSSHGYIS